MVSDYMDQIDESMQVGSYMVLVNKMKIGAYD